MTKEEMKQTEALKLALEFIERVNKDGWILADFEPQMYATITAIKEALAQEQEPVAWEQFYPDIGKPQLEQLPQLSQEVVLQYPKEAVDWQKQQKEYAQQLKVEGPCHVVCQCDKCKAQEQDNTYIYASNLATAIWQKHYMEESPKFALLDTTEGVLTQIDNMTCGLVREKPAQPEPYTEWLVCPKCDHKSPYSPIKAKTLAEDAERITKQARAQIAEMMIKEKNA